mmetsp:Transcript_66890/g.199018  ORF Transcript_66890/g.199018 Transcript_66890/m.199018 type:complete len:270 (+) Transcript_66890:1573-2382(+)
MQGEAAQGKRHVIGPARSRVREGHRGGNVSVDVGREELVVPGPVGAPHDPGGRRSREQLQEHHPEGVHLRALSHHAPTRVERAGVTDSARCVLDPVRLGVREARKAKVGHLRRAVAIQQDVGALDVAVEDLRPVLVQVRQTARHVNGRAQPFKPKERRHRRLQPPVEVTATQQLVDERAAPGDPAGRASATAAVASARLGGHGLLDLLLLPRRLARKAQEEDDVRVPAAGEEPHFLLEARAHRRVQNLERGLGPLAKITSVDSATCASS